MSVIFEKASLTGKEKTIPVVCQNDPLFQPLFSKSESKSLGTSKTKIFNSKHFHPRDGTFSKPEAYHNRTCWIASQRDSCLSAALQWQNGGWSGTRTRQRKLYSSNSSLSSLLLVGSWEQVFGKLPCHLNMFLHKLDSWIVFPNSLESHQNSRQRWIFNKRPVKNAVKVPSYVLWPWVGGDRFQTGWFEGKSHVGIVPSTLK